MSPTHPARAPRSAGLLYDRIVFDHERHAMDHLPAGAAGWSPLYAFLDASNSAVVMTDPAQHDNPIVYVNPAFEAVTGYVAADVVGRNCRLLQADDRDQAARVAMAAAVAGGEACDCLLRNYRKNGEMFWNQLYLFPLKDARGAVVRFVGIQHDVTRARALLADVQSLAAERERLVADLEQKHRHMARLSLDLVNAQETERRVLARELHDELGQRLAALNMVLHHALPCFEAGGETALWRQAEREVAAMVAVVRDLSTALRPPGLDLFGLEPSIRQLLARRLGDRLAWQFDYLNLPARLAPAIETAVYRIVQETVTNIVRHARAQHVVIAVNGDAAATGLELVVRDDGVGFDAARWREQGARAGRAGLLGMCERIELLAGTLQVDSAPGKGTRITALLPLPAGPQGVGAPAPSAGL
jgi:PAS domain S-box-containing protein